MTGPPRPVRPLCSQPRYMISSIGALMRKTIAPKKLTPDVTAEAAPLNTEIVPDRDAIPPKSAPDDDAADDVDKREIERIQWREIVAGTGQPEREACRGRQYGHDGQANEHQAERPGLLGDEQVVHIEILT